MLHRVGICLLNNHRHRQLRARLDAILPFCLGQYNTPVRFVSNRVSASLNPTSSSRLLEGELQEILKTLE